MRKIRTKDLLKSISLSHNSLFLSCKEEVLSSI